MNAIEFLNRYISDEAPFLDQYFERKGIQFLTGDETTFSADFESLSFKDKFEITRQFYFKASDKEKELLYKNSPFKKIYEDFIPIQNTWSGLEASYEVFKLIDGVLDKTDHDLNEARWTISLGIMFQMSVLEDYRDVKYYGLKEPYKIADDYENLELEWGKRYRRTVEETLKRTKIASYSAYFDSDWDGCFDNEDVYPVNFLYQTDSDYDGVDDIIDPNPASPQINIEQLSTGIVQNNTERPYVVYVEKKDNGKEHIVLESIIGLKWADGDFEKTRPLEVLARIFEKRVERALPIAIPEELRESVRLSFKFTADLGKANMVITVSNEEPDKTGKGFIESSNKWHASTGGYVMLHELGHTVFGLEDKYHQITGEPYYETDRTFSPIYKYLGMEDSDLMASDYSYAPRFDPYDIMTLIALGNERGTKLLNSGLFDVLSTTKYLVISKGEELRKSSAEDFTSNVSAVLDLLKRNIETAKEISNDPFVKKNQDYIATKIDDYFIHLFEDAYSELIMKSFDDLDDAIKTAEAILNLFHDKIIPSSIDKSTFVKENTIRRQQKNFRDILKTFKKAKEAIGRGGSNDEVMDILTGDKVIDMDGTKEVLSTIRKNEFLLDGLRIVDEKVEFLDTKNGLPKILYSVNLNSLPPSSISISIEPMNNNETGYEFASRVLEKLNEKLAEHLKTNIFLPSPASIEHNTNRNLNTALGLSFSPTSSTSPGIEHRLNYRIDSNSLYFEPHLRTVLSVSDLKLFPVMSIGSWRDYYPQWGDEKFLFDLGLGTAINAGSGDVNAYVEGNLRTSLSPIDAFLGLGLNKEFAHDKPWPDVSVYLGRNF